MIVMLRAAIAIVISVIAMPSPAVTAPETTRQTQKRDDRTDHGNAFEPSHWKCSIRGAGKKRTGNGHHHRREAPTRRYAATHRSTNDSQVCTLAHSRTGRLSASSRAVSHCYPEVFSMSLNLSLTPIVS